MASVSFNTPHNSSSCQPRPPPQILPITSKIPLLPHTFSEMQASSHSQIDGRSFGPSQTNQSISMHNVRRHKTPTTHIHTHANTYLLYYTGTNGKMATAQCIRIYRTARGREKQPKVPSGRIHCATMPERFVGELFH